MLVNLIFILFCGNGLAQQLHSNSTSQQELLDIERSKTKYFKGIKKIFMNEKLPHCLQEQRAKGWTSTSKEKKALPLYVIAVGTEASGHQMWKMLLDGPIFDCTWVSFSSHSVLSQDLCQNSHCLRSQSHLLALIFQRLGIPTSLLRILRTVSQANLFSPQELFLKNASMTTLFPSTLTCIERSMMPLAASHLGHQRIKLVSSIILTSST
jgi:hypothetical protein